MNYVRKLGFEESPDYDFLRELFSKIIKSTNEQDDGIYDWMLLNNGKGWEAGHVCPTSPSTWTKLAHYFSRHRHRSLRKLTRTLAQHKHHNASTANTSRASIGALRDRHCKKETRSLLPTQFTLRSRVVNQQLVRHRVELVATPADNLSHRQASGQASSNFRLLIYVHATLLMASPVRIHTLLRHLQAHCEVPMAMASQETLRNALRVHSLRLVRLLQSG
jgi:hypothetical protein